MENIGGAQTEGFWPKLWRTLTIRFDRRPLDSVDRLADFLQTRAAYVAQTALYGYLKTRIGIQYPTVFQNHAFAGSINISKWITYRACLADLCIFATARCARQCDLDPAEAAGLARALFDLAARNSFSDDACAILGDGVAAEFAARAARTDWAAAAEGEAAFGESPAALVRSAPIADELKQHDEEIVTNSVRFRWRDVRDQLRKRLDPADVCADWRAGSTPAV